jgi:glycine betaine/proline transport system substrate-binding protein
LHIKKFQWKHWLLLFTALAVIVTMVTGCTAEKEAVQEEKPTIKLIDAQWESLWIANSVAEIIIEEGYGYPVEQVVTTTSVYLVSFPKGELDVMLEGWPQNTPDWYKEHVYAEDGEIESLGMSVEGGPQFFMIPEWVHEEYNINSVFDMKDHWELFEDPADPTKGVFYNSLIGWECTEINKIKLEAYGLTDYYNILDTGASGSMEAALTAAQKKDEPIFGYYWAPTAIMGMYDWYILEEPEYDPGVWANIQDALTDESLRPLDEACAYESVPLPKIIHKSLRDKAPDVVAMLEKYQLGLERCNKAAAWALENEVGGDWEKVAVWYLREYDSVWKTWVTTDAYNKIKEFLDAYGAIP